MTPRSFFDLIEVLPMVDRFACLLAVAGLVWLAALGAGCADDRRTSTPTEVVTGGDGGDAPADEAAAPDAADARASDGGAGDTAGTCGNGGCALGARCRVSTDCETGACNADGICVGCLQATTCPGSDTECKQRTCVGGACGFASAPAGTVLATQVAGDCQSRRCDALGNVVEVNDDTDVPDDGNACTRDLCMSGVPSHTPLAVRTPCGSAMLCDGSAHCVACIVPADCPGQDGPCQKRSCNADGACGVTNAANGTILSAQTPGDCQVATCDGSGHVTSVADDTDVPDDGNACTGDVCTAGVPSNPPLDAGAACGGDGTCDGAGHCLQCVDAGACGADAADASAPGS